MKHPCAGMSAKSIAAFEQIAIGNDGGLHPGTVGALMKRGLIERYSQELGGRFPVRIWRYRVPLPVHMAWCEWCAENVPEPKP